MAPTSTLSLSSIYEFVQNQGQGVKGLADMGIKSLPNQYIQPLEERVKTSLENKDKNHLVPIIDMSKINNNDDEIETLICNAAEKYGFFQIINHGMPLKVLEDVKAATYRFFELPADEKSKYMKKNTVTSSVRYGTSFVPHMERALEWKDFLSLFFVSQEEALTRWPLACRNEVLEYMRSSEHLTRHLLKIFMKGLNINEIDEKKESLLMGSKRINLNFYPKCPNPELAIGVGRHSDVSTFTILLQDDVGGLYVRGLDGESWIHVPPIKGALVVNVGDALQILSNGKYKSAEHRVVANGCKDRISVPIFVNPTPQVMIAPLQEVIDEDHKPLYREVLYSDYVKNFFRKIHDGKTTIDFAKISNTS